MTKNIFLAFLIILIIYWIGITPTLKAANDFPYSSLSFISQRMALPTAWNSYGGVFGQNQLSTLWSWPGNFLYAVGAFLGVPYGVLVSVIGILPILGIGFWGIYKYASFYTTSNLGRCGVAIFYLINTYIVLIIDGGQLLWGLSYAIIPWSLYMIEVGQLNKRVNVTTILPLIFISFCDLRALILTFFILILKFIYQLLFWKKDEYITGIKYFLSLGLLAGFFVITLHAYWLVPLILSKSEITPSNLVVSTNLDFLKFISLGHALLIYQPHWYKNIFGQISTVSPFFIFIPLIALISLVLTRKNQQVGFLMVLLIVGIFLAKGGQPPYGDVYFNLIEKLPGFFLFRDSSKFYILISLAYSLMIGISIEEIEKLNIKKYKLSRLFPVLIIVYLIVLIWPLYTNQMTGLLGFPKEANLFTNIERSLTEQSNKGRVLWIPNKPPLGFMDSANPSINGIDLVNLRPFSTGIKGNYELLNYLREASYSGELLAISGVKSLVYSPLNPNKEYKPDEKNYYKLFLEQLQGRDWIESSANTDKTILNIKDTQSLFFIPRDIFLVIGSDEIYKESTISADLSLKNNGLVFLEEKSSLIKNIPNSIGKFVLYKKNTIDLLVDLADVKNFIFPSKYLTNSPDQTGWWKRDANDFLSFKDFLIQKYGIYNQDFDLAGGWAISEGENELSIPVKGNQGDYLFVRAMESSRSGVLEIRSGSQVINNLDLAKPGDNVKWHLIGQIKNDLTELQLKTTGDISIINAVTVMTAEEFASLNGKVRGFEKNGQIIDYNKYLRNQAEPKIEYQKINEDQYKLTVFGLSNPSLIVFSQIYDSKWQLNGQSPIPVYSIFNGFSVERDGEYLLEYAPHKYLVWGELISMGSLLILLGSVVYRYYGNKYQKST